MCRGRTPALAILRTAWPQQFQRRQSQSVEKAAKQVDATEIVARRLLDATLGQRLAARPSRMIHPRSSARAMVARDLFISCNVAYRTLTLSSAGSSFIFALYRLH